MKNVFKWFGIIALIAVIGFSMAACEDGSSGSRLDGTWQVSSGMRVSISGSTGVLRALGSTGYVQDAASKGYIQIGGQVFRNLNQTGDLRWSGQQLYYYHNGNVCTSTYWTDITITMSANGNTFQTGGDTWTRQY